MPFIGNQPVEQYSSIAKQDITGDGGTSYTLNAAVTSPEDIEVFINNVRQEPSTSYTVSGTTLTLTEALLSTEDCYVVYQGRTIGTKAPGDNTVGTGKIQANAVTSAKLDTNIAVSGNLDANVLRTSSIKHTNDTTAMTIDSSGRALIPAIAFRATLHRGIGWTTGGGTGNAVVFDNHSINGCFNLGFDLSNLATTGLVYFPVNGIYRISASFLLNASNSAGSTYMTICKNVTTASGGQPANVLQNDYTHVAQNQYYLVKLNTICVGNTTDYFCIAKEDSMAYWSNGTNQNASTWGYNQLTCELIGSV